MGSVVPWTLRMLLLILLAASAQASSRDDEERLLQDMLERYNPLFIPKLNKSHPIEVTMETMLKKIVEYDYEKGILTSLVWLDFNWFDEYLQWNPADYNGIERIQLPPSKVWVPDIFLFNDVSGHFGTDILSERPYLVVEANGDVRWIPPMILKTTCLHGDQEESCELKFGSWVYTAEQLDLRPAIPTMDLEGYTGSTLWDLSETRVQRHETIYDCCPEAFVDLTFTIRFHKKSKLFGGALQGKWL